MYQFNSFQSKFEILFDFLNHQKTVTGTTQKFLFWPKICQIE